MDTAPEVVVEAIDLFERDVRLRMPFRFGVVTLTQAPQVFARVQVRLNDGRAGTGMAAELLAPKWFDKNPALSNEDNFDQLRAALGVARELYPDGAAATAYGHFTRHYRTQIERCAASGLNPLVAGYGPALIDRAVLDGLCRALGLPFHAVIQRNLAGIGASEHVPDLAGFDFAAFLQRLQPADAIDARHTVGLVDPITRAEQTERVGDGLPETLEEVVAAYGQRWFKLKVGGDVAADVQRLTRIAAVLDAIPGGYRATLDGNEQYDSVDGVLALWQAMQAEPRLAALCRAVVFVEQPIKRQAALSQSVAALAAHKPVIIDESDDTLDAFVRGRAMGYRGVSSKTCKGLYKSILNRARCLLWNREEGLPDPLDSTPGAEAAGAAAPYLLSAEDLTIQAGLALQQDLALVSLLGIRHVERNGHHYVNGMADLPASEQQDFLRAHPDLYEHRHGAVRMRIDGGRLAIGSLAGVGFASGAAPQWSAMRAMPTPAWPPQSVSTAA
jgi:L-alanine-DL-glutamate epimerase-like enolase superfamily enzyme